MKKYLVTMYETIYVTREVEVEAENEEDAVKEAEAQDSYSVISMGGSLEFSDESTAEEVI